MSIFNELLPKLHEISNIYVKSLNDQLKKTFDNIDKATGRLQNSKSGTINGGPLKAKNRTTALRSIHELEAQPAKTDKTTSKCNTNVATESGIDTNGQSSDDINTGTVRLTKKRSKEEVDDHSSPELDKRLKRNASVKAQTIISKQVNVNLNQKLRREKSVDKSRLSEKSKEDDKENTKPIQIKQEKISIPMEPVDLDCVPLNIEPKKEMAVDEIAMPPPLAPVPKPRKAMPKVKEKNTDKGYESEEDNSGARRSTRSRKPTEKAMPPPPVPEPRPSRASARSTRASSRANKQPETDEADVVQITETRPKRTRTKKKLEETSNLESAQVNGIASPTEKPRPKRTKRRNADEALTKPEEVPIITTVTTDTIPTNIDMTTDSKSSPRDEHTSEPEIIKSPILQQKQTIKYNKEIIETKSNDNEEKEKTKKNGEFKSKIPSKTNKTNKKIKSKVVGQSSEESVDDEKTDKLTEENQIIEKVGVNKQDFNQTIVLPNGVYRHDPVTPKNILNMDDTVVLETINRETIVLEKVDKKSIMDATVVIDKENGKVNITEDNSLLTDDNSDVQQTLTPPKEKIPNPQPTSAVKEKVQQFEELASRNTRTKTRAMAKKADADSEETQTPPDKSTQPILSAETLTRMNAMIFNGKQISNSALKPRIPTKPLTSSTSKLSGLHRAREAAEETLKREKEDARKKKEALLEAKREQQKRKREEKMAAVSAARLAAERERRAAMEAVIRGRQEKQAHADQGKVERLKEAERKKLELARKVAETEERRKAEEQARQQRLHEEQKRAEESRRKQQEEAEATRKEEIIMAKEIERRHKEYMEKQKLKQKLEAEKTTHKMDPVHMADGFQYFNSDEDDDSPVRWPVPAWSVSQARKTVLAVQWQVSQREVDKLFSVRVHTPDLTEIFPGVDRRMLKRTSSAVWRTPPPAHRLSMLAESPV